MSNLDKILYAIVALCVIMAITGAVFIEYQLTQGRQLIEYSQAQAQAYEVYKTLKEVKK